MKNIDIDKLISKLPIAKKAYRVGTLFGYHYDNDNTETIYALNEKEARKEYYNKFYYHLDTYEGYIDIRARRKKEDDIYLFEGENLSKWSIIDKIETKQYRDEITLKLTKHAGEECYIYSGQWHQYWRSNRSGYTSNLEEAGIYSVEEACSILRGVGLEKRLQIIIYDKKKAVNDMHEKIQNLRKDEKEELLNLLTKA